MQLLRKPWVWGVLAILAVLGAFGAYWFQPWRLVTSTTVNDALTTTTTADPTVSTPPAASRVVLRGSFVTHEHDTAGEVRIVEHPDGRRQLELVNLATSDGPDLKVRLSDQPVRDGVAGWRVFDDGRWVDLGSLKGNMGNQVYDVPPDADLSTLRSVSIWCKRFAVSFGAATLA